MHGARHILRSASLMPRTGARLALECVGPMVAVVIAGALAWRFGGVMEADSGVVRILFVGLAALTAPHMALVEPVRLRGWAFAPSDSPNPS